MSNRFFKNSPIFRKALQGLCIVVTGGIAYPQVNSRFDLYYDTQQNKLAEILDKCPNIKWGYFFPTFYLGNGLLQAWFGSISRTCDPNIDYDSELLQLSCGAKIALHWAKYKEGVIHDADIDMKEAKKLLLIVPGMTACSREPYILNLISEAMKKGYKPVVYNPRGIGDSPMSLPHDRYVDLVEDFKQIVDHVRNAYPDYMMFAVGHSYGANTLVNYLGMYNETQPFVSAVSVANPFDFKEAGKTIVNTFSDYYLTKNIQDYVRKHIDVWQKAPFHMNIDLEKALSSKSIIEFDDLLTCRYMGYRSNADYYDGISSKKNLGKVQIPLLCMNSRDDPILNKDSIPYQESKTNKNIVFLVTNNGGHVGWFTGIFQPKRWFPKPAVEFLEASLQTTEVKNA